MEQKTSRNLLVAILVVLLIIAITPFFDMGTAKHGRMGLGEDLDTIFEGLSTDAKKALKAGDIIATKNPAAVCDFRYSIAINEYNTAFCSYVGSIRDIVKNDGSVTDIASEIERQQKADQ